MKTQALLNGEPSQTLSLSDRGLHYGDGVFRTLRIHAGQPVAWIYHWQRLQHDCNRLQLALPPENQLLEEVARLFTDGAHGVLKIIITRGQSGRGYTPPAGGPVTRLLMRFNASRRTIPLMLNIGVCKTRLGRNPQLAGVKHLNRLEQVLARAECQHNAWPEALMLDSDGWVISGTMSNLFIVKNHRLFTPRLDHAGVIGATRQRVLEKAQENHIETEQANLRLEDCLAADEVFLCNSVMGCRPVLAINDSAFKAGPITSLVRVE